MSSTSTATGSTSPLADDQRFSVVSDVRYRAVFDEGVVVRQRAGEVLVVNQTAIRVLEMLGEGRTIAETTAGIAAEFEVSEHQAKDDVVSFARELIAAGVLDGAEAARTDQTEPAR